MLIAIDGPAASGKGTIGKMVAEHFHLEYLDTGRLYRLVGYNLLKQIGYEDGKMGRGDEKSSSHPQILTSSHPLAIKIAKNLDISGINSEEIETEEVGSAASVVSAIPEVRAALLDFQRRIARSPKGAVLDGRDIGTVICPQADFKFFITAEAEIRAKRRFLQLQLRKKKVKKEDILRDIIARDERDKNRDIAPLIPAIDAIYIDTTNMQIEEVFEKVKGVIEASI